VAAQAPPDNQSAGVVPALEYTEDPVKTGGWLYAPKRSGDQRPVFRRTYTIHLIKLGRSCRTPWDGSSRRENFAEEFQ